MVCRDVFEYAYPDPRTLFPALESKLARVNQTLGAKASKVVGVGVAAPLWLGGWRDFLGAPPDALDAWHEIDLRARIGAMTGLPVEFAKDTTAACAARTRDGPRPRHSQFSVSVRGDVYRRRAS